jgi:signal transduction histidine kinase
LTLFYRAPHDFTAEDVELATAFAAHAALAIENARLRVAAYERTRESERRRAVAEGLAELMGVVNSGSDLAAVLSSALGQAAHLLGSDAGAVYLVGDRAGVLERRVRRGRRALPAELAIGAAPERVLALALSTREETYGAIALSFKHARRISDEELRLAHAFAAYAGLAIENVRLYERAQHAAALEERQRLARELHDAVTQTLFSASLVAEVLPRLWDANPDQGRHHLEELRRLTRGAMAEMRTLLVELRPGALNELGLGDLLRQLGEAAMGRADLQVTVSIEALPSALMPEVKLGLYRIAQEALNNVVKHARASHARIDLGYRDGALALCIADDGRGFDPRAIPAGHLGVSIMGERARALGAALQVDSATSGTRVLVRWPSAT